MIFNPDQTTLMNPAPVQTTRTTAPLFLNMKNRETQVQWYTGMLGLQ